MYIYIERFATTTYALEEKGQTSFKKVKCQKQTWYSSVSALDGYAETQRVNEWNPFIARTHTYKSYEGQGLYSTNISQGNNHDPNQ